MSRMGFAAKPGTAVLPVCSSSTASPAAAKRCSSRSASAANKLCQTESYGTTRTMPLSSPNDIGSSYAAAVRMVSADRSQHELPELDLRSFRLQSDLAAIGG